MLPATLSVLDTKEPRLWLTYVVLGISNLPSPPSSAFFSWQGLADLHDGVSLEGSSVDLMHLKIRLTSFGFIPLSMKPMDVVPLVLPINMFSKENFLK
ncbi:hypothetical protein RHSIM_Rhsim07G0200200 [Rhododendron simsii]|uniref:Uncharacterized protein n=1 Tax=Rhododendron simsii TaxID=118357 RepID=A0A834LJR1_RHOSS|nr:hypothetical protein RHSIM_Rhsim07G0200200 [Rhododendron simsii]